MNRDELKRRIEIETHFLNGGEVEYKDAGYPASNWSSIETPTFDWNTYDYRIKAAPVYIPFTQETFRDPYMVGTWFRYKRSQDRWYKCVFVGVAELKIGTCTQTYAELLTQYEYLTTAGDWKPCGTIKL